jgi:DNA-directed RNA polymerase specialized sigma24 family protein
MDFNERLERYYRDNYTALVRRFHSWGTVEDIEDAVQEAVVRVCVRYADGQQPQPERLGGLLHVAIQNVLRDGFRRALPISIDDVRAGPSGERIIAAEGGEEDRSEDIALPDPHVGPEDQVAAKELFDTVFDRLPAKWRDVAAMTFNGASPEEIGARYGQNGYVLRRYGRSMVCRVLRAMAQSGDPLAASFARELCPDCRMLPVRRRGRGGIAELRGI